MTGTGRGAGTLHTRKAARVTQQDVDVVLVVVDGATGGGLVVLLSRGWRSYVLPAFGALATGGATVLAGMLSADSLDKYQKAPANAADRSESPLWAWVADNRTLVIGVLVLVSVVPTVWTMLYTKKIRDNAKLDMVRRFLQLAQKRSFPDADGMSRRARVSLFAVAGKEDARELVCVYRTDGMTPTQRWKIGGKLGFVVRAFREQTTRIVNELKKEDAADLVRYQDESWSDATTMKTRSWPGAAMIAVPIIVRPGAEPAAVFLVETNGIEVAQKQVHEWDASMCHMLIEEI